MSKPIKLTEDLLKTIKAEFVNQVKGMKMIGGKLEYKHLFKWEDSEDDRATIFLTTAAFAKMSALIQQFSSEVAWHGVVHRDEKDSRVFRITDILVYPQTVSGVTVNTDQNEYQNWLYSFDDEIFNNIRMQGHSHVDMSVSPSGVDVTHQEKILTQIADDDYYIFMIWNKKYECFVRIFDLKNNTLYETEDVDVLIGENQLNLVKFMKETKKVVTVQNYTPVYQQGWRTSGVSPVTGVRTKPKTAAQSGEPYPTQRRSVFSDEDDAYTGANV